MSETRRSGPDVKPVVGMVVEYAGDAYQQEETVRITSVSGMVWLGQCNDQLNSWRGAFGRGSDWDDGRYEILSTPEPAKVERRLAAGWARLPENDWRCFGCKVKDNSAPKWASPEKSYCTPCAEARGAFVEDAPVPVPAKPPCPTPSWCGKGATESLRLGRVLGSGWSLGDEIYCTCDCLNRAANKSSPAGQREVAVQPVAPKPCANGDRACAGHNQPWPCGKCERAAACDAIPFNARCSTACWTNKRHVEPEAPKVREWTAPIDRSGEGYFAGGAPAEVAIAVSAVAKLPDFHPGTRLRHLQPRWRADPVSHVDTMRKNR